MQNHHDAHRATTTQSRRVQIGYEGTIDFSRGAYGVVEGSEKRRLQVEKSEEGQGAMCAIEETCEDSSDLQLQLRLQDTAEGARVTSEGARAADEGAGVEEKENPIAEPVGTLQNQVMKQIKSHRRIHYSLCCNVACNKPILFCLPPHRPTILRCVRQMTTVAGLCQKPVPKQNITPSAKVKKVRWHREDVEGLGNHKLRGA